MLWIVLAIKPNKLKNGEAKSFQIKGAVGKGTKWLSDKVGDIADWVGKPGKLLNKVLEAFGVNMDAFELLKAQKYHTT